ncbi:hypothetical protein HDU96_000188 [Phlyctochytrium bullatum]|nr:hypothetical protein HDU96_000188 [Phlyctochytrium bullatum]
MFQAEVKPLAFEEDKKPATADKSGKKSGSKQKKTIRKDVDKRKARLNHDETAVIAVAAAAALLAPSADYSGGIQGPEGAKLLNLVEAKKALRKKRGNTRRGGGARVMAIAAAAKAAAEALRGRDDSTKELKGEDLVQGSENTSSKAIQLEIVMPSNTNNSEDVSLSIPKRSNSRDEIDSIAARGTDNEKEQSKAYATAAVDGQMTDSSVDGVQLRRTPRKSVPNRRFEEGMTSYSGKKGKGRDSKTNIKSKSKASKHPNAELEPLKIPTPKKSHGPLTPPASAKGKRKRYTEYSSESVDELTDSEMSETSFLPVASGRKTSERIAKRLCSQQANSVAAPSSSSKTESSSNSQTPTKNDVDDLDDDDAFYFEDLDPEDIARVSKGYSKSMELTVSEARAAPVDEANGKEPIVTGNYVTPVEEVEDTEFRIGFGVASPNFKSTTGQEESKKASATSSPERTGRKTSRSPARPAARNITPLSRSPKQPFRIGSSDRRWSLNVAIAFADHLELLAPPPKDVQSSQEPPMYYFYYKFLDIEVLTEPFSDLDKPHFPAERIAFSILASESEILDYLHKLRMFPVYLCMSGKVLGFAEVDLTGFRDCSVEEMDPSIVSEDGTDLKQFRNVKCYGRLQEKVYTVFSKEGTVAISPGSLTPTVGVSLLLASLEDIVSVPEEPLGEANVKEDMIDRSTAAKDNGQAKQADSRGSALDNTKEKEAAPELAPSRDAVGEAALLSAKHQQGQRVAAYGDAGAAHADTQVRHQTSEGNVEHKLDSYPREHATQPRHYTADNVPNSLPQRHAPQPRTYTPDRGFAELDTIVPPAAGPQWHQYRFSVDLRSIRGYFTRDTPGLFCKYSYAPFGTTSPFITHPPVNPLGLRSPSPSGRFPEDPRGAKEDVKLPHSFNAFEFVMSQQRLEGYVEAVPLIVEIWARDKYQSDSLFGTASVDVSSLFRQLPIRAPMQDVGVAPVLRTCKVICPVISAGDDAGRFRRREVADLVLVLSLEDFGPVEDSELVERTNGVLPIPPQTSQTRDLPFRNHMPASSPVLKSKHQSFPPNENVPSTNHQAVLEFEIWRREEARKFRSHLKTLESDLVRRLTAEFASRDEERAAAVTKRLESLAIVEERTRKLAVDLETRERAVAIAEDEIKRVKEAARATEQKRKLEFEEIIDRIKEEFRMRLELLDQKASQADQAKVRMVKERDELEAKLARSEKEIEQLRTQLGTKTAAESKERQAKVTAQDSTVAAQALEALKAELSKANGELAASRKRVEELEASRAKYKAQWVRVIQELARVKKQWQRDIQDRLNSEQQQLDALRLKLMTREEIDSIQASRANLQSMKQDIEALRMRGTLSSSPALDEPYGAFAARYRRRRRREKRAGKSVGWSSGASDSDDPDPKVERSKSKDPPPSQSSKVEAARENIDPKVLDEVERLARERDSLVQSGIYSREDALIREMDRRIQRLLSSKELPVD